MNYLLKTRCTKGHLIVDENKVSVELKSLGVHNENSLPFSQITGVDIKTTMAPTPLLSKFISTQRGKATVKIYSKGNQELEAKFVDLQDAVKVKEIIENKISQ